MSKAQLSTTILRLRIVAKNLVNIYIKVRMPFYRHVRREHVDQERSGIKCEYKGCMITKIMLH